MSGMDAHPESGASAQGIDPAELAALMQSFSEVTSRLEETHGHLRSEVASLKSELAEAHARLERSAQLAALGEMAAGIAHEIRNPLGCIALNVEALSDDVRGKPEQLELCVRVSKAVTRLDTIVGDVLAFARDTRVRPVRGEISGVVHSAVMSASDLLESSDIDLRLDLDESIVAEIDLALFEQSLLNILRNACEAMIEHDVDYKLLEVELKRSSLRDPDGHVVEHAVVSVRDTGPGIPRDVRDRMFNPFFTTRGEGTGLGLAIVHRIVDAHGGRVEVQDAQPGAIVELALPVEFIGIAVGDEEDGRSLSGAVRRRVRESSDRGAVGAA